MKMELFKLLGTIAVDNSEANKALKETSSNAKDTANALGDTSSSGETSGSKLGNAFKKIGAGAVAVGKTVATGLAVGATALGGLTIKALSAAGDLEQNMGGSEAVFAEYAGKMQETAKTAFSNMGLSTSDFLGTANKMGALFQGAGFDIETSANMSSEAMQRAADVASIMGIDTESAMEAIAGAAKGNFTMMDNLGVAMNDTTLQAYALSKGIDKSTSEMTNQEKIGLAMEMFMEKTAYAAGNYAKENETLAGSLGTAKSALSNFISGAGSVDDVVTSFSNAANVIVKNIDQLFPKLMTGITELVNQIVPMIPKLLEKLLPGLIQGATGLINGLVDAMPKIVSALLAAVPALIDGITQVVNSLIRALPSIVRAFVSALPALIPALVNGIVSMILALCDMLPQIIDPIIDALPDIIVSIVDALVSNLPALIQGAIRLVAGLVRALPQILAGLISALPAAFKSIWNGIKNVFSNVGGWFKNIFGNAKDLAVKAWSGAKNLFGNIWSGIKNVFSNVGGWFKNTFTNAKESASKAWSNAKNLFSNIWSGIKGVFSNVGGWFKDKFTDAKEKASNAWSNAKSKFSNAWNNIKSAFSNVGGWFKDTFSGAKEKAVSAWSNAKSKFASVKEGIVNAFSNVDGKLSNPFTKARDKIKAIADKIKGFFKGSISLPKIKMPHFGISPKGWKIGDLLKGSIPKLSIDWYAKAMDNPMVMTQPTIFGYNSSTGQLMGGGEAGSEVVSGTNTLMNMIQKAVADQNSGLAYYLQRLLELLAEYFPQVLSAMDRDIVLDSGAMVGAMAVPMNRALGKLSNRNGRGI
jgi:phage-related protein